MLAGLADADVGVVAMHRDDFRDLTHCNKMFDYIVMRRPQIVSRTAAVESYFDGDCFEMFEAGDDEDLARAIRRLYRSPQRCEQLVERASAVNEAYRWPKQRETYIFTVNMLLHDRISLEPADGRDARVRAMQDDVRPASSTGSS
jgi:glycosyltransferase involved in cell wall biosynthesis